MKNFKRTLSLLMMSAMLILPISMPVQAEEIDNYTKEIITYNTASYWNAKITGDGVRIRKGASLSTDVLGHLYTGDKVHVFFETDGSGLRWCYIETQSGITGYVAAQYVQYL